MKRSVLMSALVLALAAAMPACGGGSGEPAKDGDSANKEGASESGDPIVELKSISEGIQKDVDAVLQPLKDADAIIDSIANLPKEVKASGKAKLDTKKLMAEAQKIVNGEEPNLDALGLEAEGKAKVKERFDKLNVLVKNVKEMDTKLKELGTRIVDAVTKVPALGAKVVAKAQVKIKAPFGVSADDKKKAEQDMKDVEALVSGFKDKAAGWQKDIAEVPAKAKGIPEKFTKSFK